MESSRESGGRVADSTGGPGGRIVLLRLLHGGVLMKIELKRDAPSDRELQRHALQKLASAVQDEDHWQQILQAATEEQREELERVVGPLLKFRRVAACTTSTCSSGKPGLWQPALEVLSPDGSVSWVPIDLHLCDDCKQEATVEDFCTDAIWSQVLLSWPSDTLPPLRNRTQLRFDRVH